MPPLKQNLEDNALFFLILFKDWSIISEIVLIIYDRDCSCWPCLLRLSWIYLLLVYFVIWIATDCKLKSLFFSLFVTIMSTSSFKQEHDFGIFSSLLTESVSVFLLSNPNRLLFVHFYAEKRHAEASRIREKYPDRIPVSIMTFLIVFLLLWISSIQIG